MLNDKVILITGGTGSFGRAFTKLVVQRYKPKKLIIFSRDEFKQSVMRHEFAKHKNLRFFIGDVRDKERLKLALYGIDYVVHAAALKQVPAMEYNPTEAIKTNVMGAANVIDASLENRVKRVIALSTDKACSPINLYGATKLCADKLFIAANSYRGTFGTKFSVVRYGNVVGSRGSVIPLFLKKRVEGVLPITHPDMTRFFITLEQAVRFVLKNLERMKGGELFVPKIPSIKIIDIAKAIAPECKTKIVGIRPGEKLHEEIISQDDARNTVELEDCYIVQPAFHWWGENNRAKGKKLPEGFKFSSDTNKNWLTAKELKKMIKDL